MVCERDSLLSISYYNFQITFRQIPSKQDFDRIVSAGTLDVSYAEKGDKIDSDYAL